MAATAVRSKRRQATRNRLLDAARDVFAERGVQGGTVEEICERAHFTRGAFYSNFEDKDQLIIALLDREAERVVARLTESIGIGPGTDLAAVGRAIETFLDSDPVDRRYFLIESELALHAIRAPELARNMLVLRRMTTERVGELIAHGMVSIGRELTVDLDDAVETVLAIAARSTQRAFLDPEAHEPHDLAHAVIPKVIEGLSRPVGP